MKTIFLACDNTANIPWTLVDGLKRYSHHSSSLIQTATDYLDFPTGIIFGEGIDQEQLENTIKAVDIVHINEGLLDETHLTVGSMKIPLSLFEDKKVIRHAHGTVTRRNYRSIAEMTRRYNIFNIVATPDLLEYLPNAVWLPNPLDLEKPMYNFRERKFSESLTHNSRLYIAHAPTNTQLKSTALLENTITKLSGEFGVEYTPMQNLPHYECMKKKAECDFHFDSIRMQIAGVSTLESLALGHLCFVGVTNNLPLYRGLSELEVPFIDVTEDNLIQVMQEWLELSRAKPRLLTERAQLGRQWVEEVHSLPRVIQRLEDIYSSCGMFKADDVPPILPEVDIPKEPFVAPSKRRVLPSGGGPRSKPKQRVHNTPVAGHINQQGLPQRILYKKKKGYPVRGK